MINNSNNNLSNSSTRKTLYISAAIILALYICFLIGLRLSGLTDKMLYLMISLLDIEAPGDNIEIAKDILAILQTVFCLIIFAWYMRIYTKCKIAQKYINDTIPIFSVMGLILIMFFLTKSFSLKLYIKENIIEAVGSCPSMIAFVVSIIFGEWKVYEFIKDKNPIINKDINIGDRVKYEYKGTQEIGNIDLYTKDKFVIGDGEKHDLDELIYVQKL